MYLHGQRTIIIPNISRFFRVSQKKYLIFFGYFLWYHYYNNCVYKYLVCHFFSCLFYSRVISINLLRYCHFSFFFPCIHLFCVPKNVSHSKMISFFFDHTWYVGTKNRGNFKYEVFFPVSWVKVARPFMSTYKVGKE